MIAKPLTYERWLEIVAEIKRGLEERAAADFVPEPVPILFHPDDLVLLERFASRVYKRSCTVPFPKESHGTT